MAKHWGHWARDLFYTFVSITNTQSIFSRFVNVKEFLPLITLPRYARGANISSELAAEIIAGVPSYSSKAWTHYWRDVGLKFESQGLFRAACMSYVMGVFPKENTVWKKEIHELKRRAFARWAESENIPFKEKFLDTPEGRVRFYWFRPNDYSTPVPMTIFVNGLEGSAEEIAFTLQHLDTRSMGFACLSVPGSADYDRPMSASSEKILTHVISDLSAQPWVDPSQIGMVGFSMGAYWTFICAKTDPRVRFSLCNGIPLFHTLSGGSGLGLNPVICEALLRIFGVYHPVQLLPIVRRMTERAQELISRPSGPILAMDGDGDTIVDPRDTETLGRQPGNRLLLIKNDDHCGLFHYDRMVSIISHWTRRNISLVKSEPWRKRAFG